MNWLDIIVIIILAIPTLMGLRRGLIKTVVPLAGIILGVFIAGQFYEPVGDWLSNWLESSSQANIAGFALVFVGVLVAAVIVAGILSRFVKLILLGWVDRLGGMLLGLAIGGFVAGALLALLTKFSFPGIEDTVRDSVLAEFFLDSFPFVLGLLPHEFDAVRDFFGI